MTDLPQPGPELDCLILERVYRVPRKKVFEVSGGLYYIPSGKPRRTHMSDAVPVPRFSFHDYLALAALERFCKMYGTHWTITRFGGRYTAALHGDKMPVYGQSAATLAHAIVLALLAAVRMMEAIDAE